MNIIHIISDLFIAAMAVFGLWCAFEFLLLSTSVEKGIRCAVSLSSLEDADKLERTVCELDLSALVVNEPRYAVLLDREIAENLNISEISSEVLDRVEFYVLTEIPKKE